MSNPTYRTTNLKLAAWLRYNKLDLANYAWDAATRKVVFEFTDGPAAQAMARTYKIERPVVELKRYLDCWEDIWELAKEVRVP